MDAREARTILAERLARYREYPYERLAQLVGSQEVEEQRGPAGTLPPLPIIRETASLWRLV
jgi:hypothetical protein